MRNTFVLLLTLVLFCASALGETTTPAPTQKEYFDAQVSASYMVDVPNRGPMRYYAQNDPMYATVKYENRKQNKFRKFATGACVPTSLAMALANLLPMDRLPEISSQSYMNKGFRFCECSCGPFHCSGGHEQYLLTTPQEFYRYLPMVTGSYACGNGPKGVIFRRNVGGTSTNLFKTICSFYGLEFKNRLTHEEALEGIQQGAVCIVSTGGRGTPFANGGHYMILASFDDEYLYFLDPIIKESYKKTDKNKVLEILDTGLVRAKRSDLRKLYLSSYSLIYPPAEN